MGFDTIVLLLLAVLVIVIVSKAIVIVPQATVRIVERLGKFNRTLDAGLHVIIPWLDQLKSPIDLREQVVTFPPQPVITQDNVTISIDTVLYFLITDPFRAEYEVANLILAVEQITITTLRNVIGSLTLDEALTSRDKINAELRIVLDEATERWGIRVARIEVKSIDPPASIQEAMEKQMRAERDKRATILEAEGGKQSQILTAEGDRQAKILTAEGDRQAAILTAEGDKQSQILTAEGEAAAIKSVFDAIHAGRPTEDLLTYQYLRNTLPQVADGQSTKLMLVPSDAMAAMGAAAALGGSFKSGEETASSGQRPSPMPPA